MRPLPRWTATIVFMTALTHSATAQAPPPTAPAPDPNAPVYVTSFIDVTPPQKNAAIKLLKPWVQICAKEEGNQRCELLQRLERQNQFVLLEIWKDQRTFKAHEAAASTAQLRDKLKPMLVSPYDQRLQSGMAVLPPEPAPSGRVVHAITHVDVIPPRTADAVALLTPMAAAGRKDAGNLRLEVQQFYAPRLNHFTVIETWRNKRALELHQMTPAMTQYREKIQPMLGALYDERLYMAPD